MGSRRIVTVMAAAAAVLAGAAPPAGADAGPPTTTVASAIDAVLAADGSGWLLQEDGGLGVPRRRSVARRAADGTVTPVGDGWSPSACAGTELAGTAERPLVLAGSSICPVSPEGDVTSFPVPPTTDADQMVEGPGGLLWFAGDGATSLGRIDLELEQVTAVAVPGSGAVRAVGLGPDGAVRVARGAGVARVGDDGVPTPELTLPSEVLGLFTGPDERLWAWLADGRLVAADEEGTYDVVVADGPASPGATVVAAGRAWFGDGNVLVGVTPDGAVRRAPLGLTDDGTTQLPTDETVVPVRAVGDDLLGVQDGELWSIDATAPIAVVSATVRLDLTTPEERWLVRVDARDEQGQVVAGTVEAYRFYRTAGQFGSNGYAKVAEGPVAGPDDTVVVPPLDCEAEGAVAIQPGPAVFRPDGTAVLPVQAPLVREGPDIHQVRTVRRIFRQALGRGADPAGLAHWAPRWTDQAGPRTVIDPLVRTREAEVRLVDQIFRQALGRRLDAASAEHWRAALRATGQRRVTAQVVASAEALRRAGGTNPGWVDHAFAALLGRTPAPSERAVLVARLQGGASRGSVAQGLQASPDGIAHRASVVRAGLGLDPEPRPAEVSGFTTEEALRRQLLATDVGEPCPPT